MAVYKRFYRPYVGDLTPEWSRFLILPRFAMESLFRSRLLTGYMALCLLPPLAAAVIIYIYNNPLAQAVIGLQGEPPFRIDGQFFYFVLKIQGGLAFLLAAWVGPGLVAPDLANNALQLYLCRPFSRVEYVLGRFATLFILLSAITWAPDLLLYGLQAALAPDGWLSANLRIAQAIVLGSWIWIAILSLLALALSAWVKWRIAATGLFAGIFFVAAGFGEALNEALRTYWGSVLNLYYLITVAWCGLFDLPLVKRQIRIRVGDVTQSDVPEGVVWAALLAICLVCLLLLNRRLRAREVIRG